ncbi:MAG: hypothetical protein FWF10_03185 [Clostridiales bacterium]|nr:hypothetical protein [Clostridiales bacterium]
MQNAEISVLCRPLDIPFSRLIPPLSSPSWAAARAEGRVDAVAHERQLHADTGAAYPWANVLLLLAQCYDPFPAGCGISPYYIASNTFYHKTNALLDALQERDIRAERAKIPFRAVFLEAGIGRVGRNALLSIEPYGTRVALQVLALALEDPIFDPIPARDAWGCGSCTVCQDACPTGAIDESGWHGERCLRAHYYDDPPPPWVLAHADTLLGCEHCQNVCPRNAHLRAVEPSAETRAALDPARILSGDIAPALTLVGKNQKRHLIRSAVVLTKRI